VEGKPSGFRSFRSHVWTDVDKARCGYQAFMLDGSFSYRAYVDWALDAPMLFLRRDGEYRTPGITFRQLLKDGYEGKPADYSDWVDHLSTLFPEVRIKKVLEVRGADCVDATQTGALPALWRGILYDAQALDEALRLLPVYTLEQQNRFQDVARREGLRGTFDGKPLAKLAGEMVEIARGGLKRLDPEDAPLLDVLAQLAADRRSPADRVLEQWARNPDPAALFASAAL
jgi:glutamate--cysteine ligase